MARNRKYQSAGVRFGPPVKAVLLCLLIGGSGVGYVWQKSQIDDLARQLVKREHRLRELNDLNDRLRKQQAYVRSQSFLKMRIKELNLGLEPAPLSQVCRLAEPAREAPRPTAERQYLAQAPRTQVLP